MKEVKVPEYEASPRQTKFHQSTADETMYGGAAGGGKSAALVAEGITYGLEYPKARIYIFRKTIPELKQSIVPEIYKQCADFINLAKGMTYNSQDRVFNFTNGSMIQLAYLETIQDMFKYQSAEIHLLLIDELTHFTLDEYEYLKTRVRSTGEFPLRTMSATNPGNIGHNWVKSYFIDIAPAETIYTDKNGNTRQFIPAKVSDHPSEAFRETYTKQLSSLSDPNLRRALLEGDWDVFAGQAFPEWKRETEDGKPYHVVAPFEIPVHWTKWFAYDWGYNSFAAGVWLTKDPSSERIYMYREFYEHAMAASKQAETIMMYDSDEKMAMRLADPSLWKQIGSAETGETVAAIFQRSNLIFQPANNDRKAGWNAVHEALAPMPDGLPGLQVFSSCVNFIRTFPSLPLDLNRIEDVMTKGVEDHCLRGDTLVDTEKGQVKIKDLVGSTGLLWSMGGLKKFHSVRKVAIEGVYELSFANGKKVCATAEHPFMTQEGWVNAVDLRPHHVIRLIYAGESNKSNNSAVQWSKLLQVWQILFLAKQALQGFTQTAQSSLGVSQWSYSGGAGSSSQKPQQREQSARESRATNSVRTHEISHDGTDERPSSQSQSQKTHDRSFDSFNEKMARFARRLGLAQATCTQFTGKRYLGREEVYNLEVEDTHCFSVEGGILTHNCADAVRYGLMNARPGTMPEPKINQALVNQREKYASYR